MNLRKLNHENIVKVYELYIDIQKGKIFTVMELVNGGEMFEIIKDSGSYSGKQYFFIFFSNFKFYKKETTAKLLFT